MKLVKDCDIDFSKKGWNKQLSELLGIPIGKTTSFLNLFFPDIYETAYKRKTKIVTCPYCGREIISIGVNSHIKHAHPEHYKK